ncbi:hypothetical protein [Tardiphaga sp.]|jgi:hypothetical protein|uniref:hypothetical protein n=1 Tax=Tardiphaga sp. TaxID=1926292 RepID=UPI0037D9EAE9
MDHFNAPSFFSPSATTATTKRKIDWPVVVVAVAAVSTVVWSYALFRTVAQLVQFAVS